MGRRSESGGIREWRGKVRLDFHWRTQRLRPVLDLIWNERNQRAARRLLEQIKSEIRHGIFDPAKHFPEYRGLARLGVARPEAPTFRVIAKAYLKSIGELAHSTQVSYERILEGHWYETIGDKQVHVIRRSDLDAVLMDLRAKTRNNVLIPCRAVLAYAEDEGALDSNPAAKVKNAKVQRDEPDPFDMDEVEAIVKDLRAHNAEDADYFEFAFFTGLRPSEQIALEWRDFDRKRGLLRVQRARVWAEDKKVTKTHHGRNLELLDRAAAVLQRQRARTELAGGPIFRNPRTGKPWNDEQVQRKVLDAALKRVGVRHRPPKQTRHTFATMCLMTGANPAWVARQLGHKSTKMLYEVYSRWIDGADKGLEKAKVEAGIRHQFVTAERGK
jgi:integrase